MAAATRPIEVLIVEDSPTDAQLALEALEDSAIDVNLHIVEDGIQALDFLKRRGEHRDATRPDLVLLDLNLPKMDGGEVLAEIRSDRELLLLPVVVLTTSEDAHDVRRAYEARANCYVAKPVDFDRFLEVVRSIEDFWFKVAKLPQA